MKDDEEVLQRYGTPLEPLDEDEVPAKKPIGIEDQIVTDENGRRRFHGAFTGGFSAGFWNTVGSLEGWKPSDFKSSRKEKAPQRSQQKPEDFMDDEDLGEFGIAPQRIQAQSDFKIETETSNRKRKLLESQATRGPIPGVPVLAELLRPVEDKIAVRILKSMGWKPGQGIGPRLTSKQKKRTRERNRREEYVLRRYGDMQDDAKSNDDLVVGMSQGSCDDEDSDDDEDENDNELTFAPDDYDSLVCTSKTNRFGLGYTGLSHETSDGSKPAHINLFGPLEVVDKNNKKLSIRGQAFGVGALEEEDEDIYAGDDLTKYDFSLADGKPKRKAEPKAKQDRHIVDGFEAAKHDSQYQAPFVVEPPAGFQPRNWAVRKSRFAPLSAEKRLEIESAEAHKKSGLGRHDLNPAERSEILEGKSAAAPTAAGRQDTVEKRSVEELLAAQKRRDERTKSMLERISRTDNFTRGGIINTKGVEEVLSAANEAVEIQPAVKEEQELLMAKACSKTKGLVPASKDNSGFKPFLNNESKQLRYEKFLAANLTNEDEITKFLATIQPVDLSEWDREMERKEFIQARKIYKPLRGRMSDRFVSEATLKETEKTPAETKPPEKKVEDPKKITMERTKEMWKPHALLCKRYNIEEPFGGSMPDGKPSYAAKSGIFDYLETSVNRKDNFQTPVIIPKHIEKPKAIVRNQTAAISKPAVQMPITPSITIPTSSTPSTHQLDKISVPISTVPSIVPANSKPFKMPPKTELEKRVEESRDKPPAEKVELFRAIFEDSDDEDDVKVKEDNDKSTGKEESMPKTSNLNLDIEKLGLPILPTPPTAETLDTLKKITIPGGIFATLFTAKPDEKQVQQKSTIEVPSIPQKMQETETERIPNEVPNKITFKPRNKRQHEIEEFDNAYGPVLPAKRIKKSESSLNSAKSTVDFKLLKLLQKHKSKRKLAAKDLWIERTTTEEKDGGDHNDESSRHSNTDTNNGSEPTSKRRKKKTKKNKSKKSAEKLREKNKAKKLKKKAKTKKKSKKKIKIK